MRRFLLFFIFLAGVTASYGQYTSRLGRFTVDEIRGCAPFTVTITNANVITTGQCTGGAPCLMDFEGNGVNSTNRFTFPYTTPGTYKLSVLYQSIGADDITITVVENKDPTFEVYTCVGTQVSLKVTDKSYDTYIIDFNSDNNPETTIPSGNNATASFDYGAPGTYQVSVRGKNLNSATNCKVLSESYTTLAVLPTPSLNVMTAVDANNLKLDMTTSPHIQYKLEIAINNSGSFQPYLDLYQVNTFTVPNLLVNDNYYCFRISAFDPCANTNTYSNIVCSQNFDVNFANGVNQLTFNTSTAGVTSVDIFRNGTGFTTIAGPATSYNDSDYDCNKEYCYQVTVNYPSGVKSISLSKCGVGILQTTFPAINNVTSIVRVGAELSWVTDPLIDIDKFDILKSTPGTALSLLAQSPYQAPTPQRTYQSYIDQTYDYAGGSCYQINYADFCNNKSLPGIIACPMALTGTVDDNNAVTLNWNTLKGYQQGVQTYSVNKYTRNGTLIGSYPTTDTTFLDFDPADEEQVVIYSIIATPNEPGVDKSISNNITIEKPVKLILPTAFTPNGDGINPLFTISGKFVSKMSIKIFDRWGVLVFSSEKNEPWDGTKGGKAMPESAYVWKAEVHDFAGNTFTKEGTILLLRPPK